MKTVNLKINFIGEQSTTDLSDEMRDEFFTTKEKEYHNENYLPIIVGSPDGYNLINIDKLLTKLIELNSNGATHVDIGYHGDHNEYNIYGFEIYREPEEDKAERLAREELEHKAKIQIKIDELNKQLEDLENELHSK